MRAKKTYLQVNPNDRPAIFKGPQALTRHLQPKKKNCESLKPAWGKEEKEAANDATWSHAPGAQPKSRTADPGVISLYLFCI